MVKEAAISQCRRANDIAKGEAGKGGLHYVFRLHHRDVGPQNWLPVDVMELRAHYRRAERLNFDASTDEFARQCCRATRIRS